jgi:hypothetical protein
LIAKIIYISNHILSTPILLKILYLSGEARKIGILLLHCSDLVLSAPADPRLLALLSDSLRMPPGALNWE